jgi:2-keto-4-pentenoate hydratase/2-oxohepta-3-ene-1,7-dioic acid hydratase in catechol pathway
MIFDIAYIISDLSKGFTLKAGNIICTGTIVNEVYTELVKKPV